MKNCIGGTLNLAIDDEIIPSNPAHKLGRVIRAKGLRMEVDPLNREELSHLLGIVQEHYPIHYPLTLLLARTGLRIGEALALQWGDIDFHGRFINIRRNFSRGRIETPKSGKSRRVDMSLQLKDALLDLRHQRRLEAVRKGWGQVPEWLLVGQEGRALHANHWRKIFDKAVAKAGLRKIRIHDLRHNHASMLIQADESLAYIRDQLGHHGIKVTVDIYGHLAPEGNKSAMDRLDDHPSATIRNLSATTNEKGVNRVG
jgi:integrase